MRAQYRCGNEQRRRLITETRGDDGKPLPGKPTLNGIDYLEVEPGQAELKIFFLNNLPEDSGPDTGQPEGNRLNSENILIEGGVRIKNIKAANIARSGDKILKVTVDKAGDFSLYTLRLVKDSDSPDSPPDGYDPQLSEVQFSFDIKCRNDFDCRTRAVCPQEHLPEPLIDYLAKDYASFRQLMLDRLSLMMPEWKERSPADVMIALVEALAYLGDHLSYYQDAVATEAYLGTARKRSSVRRHARLLDYFMHDGCNARTWVALEVGLTADGKTLPASPSISDTTPKTVLLTKTDAPDGPIPADSLTDAINKGAQPFETMHEISLYEEHNKINFYDWGDMECCLPKGAARATLKGHYPNLKKGDVLIFEEVIGPTTGQKEDADPAHRWAVRLTDVKADLVDPLNGQPITEIKWDFRDALPFPLCLTARTDAEHGHSYIPDVSVALGNVVLADHGLTMQREDLSVVPSEGNYHPPLKSTPVTRQSYVRDGKKHDSQPVLFDSSGSASSVFSWDSRNVMPAIVLLQEGSENLPWHPRRDLLESDRFARDFVVESEDDERTYLRFGDDVLGEQPEPGARISAIYRTGNGKVGNIGADTIVNIITDVHEIKRVRNPLPGRCGTDPEDIEKVRLYAPQAFRSQERAVTEEDYADVAMRYPEVQKAVATIRWTGSWYTVFIAIDRAGGLPVDAEFRQDMLDYLNLYRMMGYDLEIGGPIYVPLDIAMEVCVKEGYFKSNVLEALLKAFSNRDLPGGSRGFFHPDNFTFNQPVYLSLVYKTAMDIPGVASVKVKRFQRWGRASNNELADRILAVGLLEIVRLDNDWNFPENGKIDFNMEGGM